MIYSAGGKRADTVTRQYLKMSVQREVQNRHRGRDILSRYRGKSLVKEGKKVDNVILTSAGGN